MIYLIRLSDSPSFKYWITTNTAGACLSAPTPQDALIEFVRASFKLISGGNSYTIADQHILSRNKRHGDILAKAPTIRQLIDNYPEYFI